MFETRNRLLWAAIAALGSLALGGCSASRDGEESPAPPSEDFKALFNLATGAIPHPIDLFFAGSNDGTLNLPAIAYRPPAMRDALNALVRLISCIQGALSSGLCCGRFLASAVCRRGSRRNLVFQRADTGLEGVDALGLDRCTAGDGERGEHGYHYFLHLEPLHVAGLAGRPR